MLGLGFSTRLQLYLGKLLYTLALLPTWKSALSFFDIKNNSSAVSKRCQEFRSVLSGYSRLGDIGGKDEEQRDLFAQSHAAFLTTHSHIHHGQTELLALLSSLFPQVSCFQNFPRSGKSFSNSLTLYIPEDSAQVPLLSGGLTDSSNSHRVSPLGS